VAADAEPMETRPDIGQDLDLDRAVADPDKLHQPATIVIARSGWSRNGGGQGDPCTAAPGPDPVPAKTGGWIVGHFIKYVDTIGGGTTGDTCDFSSFGSCVAVLTK